MNQNKKSFAKHSIGMLILCVMGVTLVMVGSSYALITAPVTLDTSIVNFGSLQISYDENYNRSGDVVTLNSAYPSSDEVGQLGSPYQFTLTNISDKDINYKVQIVNDESMIRSDGCADRLVSLELLRLNVNNGIPLSFEDLKDVGYTVSSGVLRAGESLNYKIRIWINEVADEEIVLNQHYHGRLVVKEVAE